jgi:hypothetical protein
LIGLIVLGAILERQIALVLAAAEGVVRMQGLERRRDSDDGEFSLSQVRDRRQVVGLGDIRRDPLQVDALA